MQSRMDKYANVSKKRYERSKKNTKLYEEVYDDIYRNTTYKNMEIIDSAKEININKLKNILDDKYDTKQYRTLRKYSIEDIDKDDRPIFNERSEKVYDINEILDKAKSRRSFLEEAKEKQKYIDFSEYRGKRYSNKYEEIEKEEQELEELINTMAIPKKDNETKDALDMFSDLKGSDDTIVTNPVDTSFEVIDPSENTKTSTEDIKGNLEKTLVKADRTFYTDSNMFTKNDFEDFSTLKGQLRRTSRTKKLIIVLIVLIALAVIGYFIYTKLILK